MNVRIILTFFLLLFAGTTEAKKLFFTHIAIDSEQSQSSAISIWQDELGGIWFGNSYLNLYADNLLKTYRISDHLTLVEDGNIHAICGGSNRQLYLLADTRLVRFDIRQEQFTDMGLEADAISYHNNQLYYAHKNQLFLYNEAEKRGRLLATLPVSATKITHLFFADSSCWLATECGVYQFTNRQLTCLLPEVNASSLFIDSSQNLWVGTAQSGLGLLERRTGTWSWYQEQGGEQTIAHNRIRCINEDSRGNLWVGTYKGLSIIDSTHQQVNHILCDGNTPYSLSHSSVYSIYKDRQGGMWVGTYYGGLDYLNPNTDCYSYLTATPGAAEGLNGFILNNMTEDSRGNLYIGAEEGGVNILHKPTLQISHLTDPTGRFHLHTVKDVWFDTQHNRLFIGTFMEGLVVYEQQSGRFRQIQSSWMTQRSHSIILGLKPWGDRLIVLTQGGLFLLDRESLELSPLWPKGVAEKETPILQNMQLSGNRLWIASAAEGLFYLDLQSGQPRYPKEIQAITRRATVNSICEDRQGRLYLVILGKGIVRYNPESRELVHYRQEGGELLTNSYFKALIAPSGELIASFANGLTLLDTQSGKANHIRFDIQSPHYLLTPNSGIYLSPDTNELFVGGVKGLLVFRMDELDTRIRPYSLWFSSLAINNQPATPVTQPRILTTDIAYVDTLHVPYNSNNLSFSFASSNYCRRNSLYEYKLEGYDRQWTTAKHQAIAYTALPPGRYCLTVREVGDSGKQIRMHIVVHPPFYASLWALLLYAILFILFILWVIRFNRSRALLQASLVMEHRDKLRMEEMNQMKLRFFTNISHELRTPLTLISSQLEVALRDHPLTTALKRALQRTYSQALYMQELITEIVNFRRMEQEALPLQVSYADITRFLVDIFDVFKPYAKERSIDYRLQLSEEEHAIWFDATQLKKVIYNLLSNAFKFTPDGGSIQLQLVRTGGQIEITVSDTGLGIPPEQRERIFEPFYRVENSSTTPQGSGIGLTLTRTIVLQHQGTIAVTDNPGGGSRFTITLPVEAAFSEAEKKTRAVAPLLQNEEPEEEAGEGLPVAAGAYTAPKPTLLLVEDNPELLTLLEEAFSPIYRVYRATNGQEGLEAALELLPDLIVSDVMMPLLSGNELCQQLKNRLETSHIPILLLTAQATAAQLIQGLTDGADDYITKPFNMQALLLKCKNLIRQRQRLLAHFQVASPPVDSMRELATNRLDQELLERSVTFIEENLQNELFDIDCWCAEMAVSRSKLNSKIKAISGLTLNDFILQVKLNKSCKLLLTAPELTVAEIAYQCGFTSASYFGKCFRARYNSSPGEYRSRG